VNARISNRRLVAGLSLLALAVAGCSTTEVGTGADTGGGSTLDQVKEKGSITVGFANERPYAYQDGGDLVGQAPAVQGYVYDQIGGIELDGKQFGFDALIPALNAQRVDTVTAGMFITPERCQEADFSNPVYVATTSLLVPEGNPMGLSDYGSVVDQGAKLAVMNGAVEASDAAGAGVPKGQLVTVADQPSGLSAITSGRADAFALTSISLRALAEGESGVEVAEAFTPVVDGEEVIGAGAAVFRKGDDELREAFNAELAKLLADKDQWLELVEPYGFTEAELPPADLTADQLCQG
jgi:polar amino acid transport system substrate-binding protein